MVRVALSEKPAEGGTPVTQAMAVRSRETRGRLIAATLAVLTAHGYSGLSTRRVAEAAGMPMSQIRYHFGSKEGMILALFEAMNVALIDRQQTLFQDTAQSLSQKWDRACDYLEEDLASGYVRILQELIAAGWSDPVIRERVCRGIDGWYDLITGLAREAESRFGTLAPLEPGDFTALIGAAFLGAESQILLGRDSDAAPHRRALRRFGAVLRLLEETSQQGG
jgi:AcrR family transcriptional regulator